MRTFTRVLGATLIVLFAAASARDASAGDLKEVRLDYAYYNPLSLVLKDKGWLEEDLEKVGIRIVWVLSLGSNKALEFLNARGLDLGSTAGAAALLGRINGNPIKSIYVYSRPEWTALVTLKNSPIQTVADLKGQRVAVTRGTDPHIFLVRTLAEHGLSDKDVRMVLLQHQDGRLALENGDVIAWAGLDPMMAQMEVDLGARLFYRNADNNTWGVLNVREAFAAEHPDVVNRVLENYERARKYALDHPDELKKILAEAAKISDPVAARQLERTDLSSPFIGERQQQTIEAAGLALQGAGLIAGDIDVKAATADLIDPSFSAKLAAR